MAKIVQVSVSQTERGLTAVDIVEDIRHAVSATRVEFRPKDGELTLQEQAELIAQDAAKIARR